MMNQAYIDSLIEHNKTGKLLHYINKNAYLLSMDNIKYIIAKCMLYDSTSLVVIGIDILGRFGREIFKYIKKAFRYYLKSTQCSYFVAKYLHKYDPNEPFEYFGTYDMTKYALSHTLSIYYQTKRSPYIYKSPFIFGSLSNSRHHDHCKLYTNDRCIDYLLTSEITLKYSFNNLINKNNWNCYIAPHVLNYFKSNDSACKYPHLYSRYQNDMLCYWK
jgi:hypothetical protein